MSYESYIRFKLIIRTQTQKYSSYLLTMRFSLCEIHTEIIHASETCICSGFVFSRGRIEEYIYLNFCDLTFSTFTTTLLFITAETQALK